MKNIHILPTDKTSRLFLSPMNNLKLSDEVIGNLYQGLKPQNIYITSPEEIKEGDWFIHSSHEITTLLKAIDVRGRILDNQGTSCNIDYCKKIILTTDPSLAPDVQKIDDEFLDWFIKNSSCEYIKTEKWLDDEGKVLYSRIIPKEEPKQETLEEACNRFYENNIDDTNIEREHHEDCIKELMIGFANQWQQERSYSEEDFTKSVKDAYIMGRNDLLIGVFNKWFEQFKKK